METEGFFDELQIEGFEICPNEPEYKALECLKKILEAQVLEVCPDGADFLVPYMMNDALEYYLRFTDARLMGAYDPEKDLVLAQLVRGQERSMLILGQEDGSRCTLSFRSVEESARCYQYHSIGHFWVEGQEQWRQLVYIIGTIRDKYEYFGDRFCRSKEQELMHLIHFPPFRKWTPIHETLEERYPTSKEGLETMERLAEEAGDRGYLGLLHLYRLFPCLGMECLLARQLCSGRRQRLYELIYKKVAEASREYVQRDYGPEANRQMETMRRKLEEELKEHGFEGKYPVLQKGELQVIAAEEHPFTVMESDEYAFRIRLMVSGCPRREADDCGRCAGFFRGKGRSSRIVSVQIPLEPGEKIAEV